MRGISILDNGCKNPRLRFKPACYSKCHC
jgi:hypothetical protein